MHQNVGIVLSLLASSLSQATLGQTEWPILAKRILLSLYNAIPLLL